MRSPRRLSPLIVLMVFALALALLNRLSLLQSDKAAPEFIFPRDVASQNVSAADLLLKSAYDQRQSHVFLGGEGRIKTLLPDDTQGSRHQRFIVVLESGQSLLIAHNIDLAQPIESLVVGELIEFYGEYIWNEKGGLIHWTHRDPKGQKAGGWLRYRQRLYQ